MARTKGIGASATKIGLVFGLLLGGWHFLWAVLVALHLAQPVVDFLFWLHFIKPLFVVETFDLGRALVLVLVTSVIGFVLGWSGAWLWRQCHKPLVPRDFS